MDYAIQSKAENNRICFITKLDNLSRALKSASSAMGGKSLMGGVKVARRKPSPPPVAQRRLAIPPIRIRLTTLPPHHAAALQPPHHAAAAAAAQVKLTKKGGAPALTFEIVLSDSQAHVVHDVPLRVVQELGVRCSLCGRLAAACTRHRHVGGCAPARLTGCFDTSKSVDVRAPAGDAAVRRADTQRERGSSLCHPASRGGQGIAECGAVSRPSPGDAAARGCGRPWARRRPPRSRRV